MRGIALGIIFFSLLPFIFMRGRLFGYFTKGPFFGILIWYWVSLMTPQFLVWASPFRYVRYALIVAIAMFLSLLLSNEPKLPPRDKVTITLILFMAWISITSWFGNGPRTTVDAYFLIVEKVLLLSLVAYMLTTTRERIEQLLLVCALSVGFLGFKGGVWAVLRGGSGHVQGPGGMLSGNNELGIALAMFLPLLFYLHWRWSRTYFKWPLRIFIVFAVIGDLFTYSRGAMLALSAMLAVTWFRSRHKLVSAMLVATLAVGMLALAPQKWMARMASIEHYQTNASAVSRLYLWRLAWAMSLKHPFGSGFWWAYNYPWVNRELADSNLHWPFVNESIDLDSTLPPLDQTKAIHSIWFEVLSDQGFPGLLLFLAVGLSVFFNARWLVRHTRDRPDLVWANNLGRAMEAALVGYAIGGSFASLYYYDGFYVLVIMAAAARRVTASELSKAAVPAGQAALARRPRARRPLRPRPVGGAQGQVGFGKRT